MPLGESFPNVLSGAQAGAEWSWDALYRHFSGPVLGYLRARGAAEPDDLVGEVFLQLARNIRGFQGDESQFRSWVFTVAHHRLVDEQRARGRRPSDPVPNEDLEPGTWADAAEEQALGRLSVERAHALIRSLSPDQRDVLLLRVLGGLTVDEVAMVLGKRRGAVKALQRRALASLQRSLQPTEAAQ
jgi:RNA polymerase sigma-70 factor (ECF subfamily)